MAQKSIFNIRRCRACGYKTHKKYWDNDVNCPVCGKIRGYAHSYHGGLSKAEMAMAKINLIKKQRQISRMKVRAM